VQEARVPRALVAARGRRAEPLRRLAPAAQLRRRLRGDLVQLDAFGGRLRLPRRDLAVVRLRHGGADGERVLEPPELEQARRELRRRRDVQIGVEKLRRVQRLPEIARRLDLLADLLREPSMNTQNVEELAAPRAGRQETVARRGGRALGALEV